MERDSSAEPVAVRIAMLQPHPIDSQLVEEEFEQELLVVRAREAEEQRQRQEMIAKDVARRTVEDKRRQWELHTARLFAKVANCNIPVPPLCCCLSNDLYIHANNCPFYQKPGDFVHALDRFITTLKIPDTQQ